MEIDNDNFCEQCAAARKQSPKPLDERLLEAAKYFRSLAYDRLVPALELTELGQEVWNMHFKAVDDAATEMAWLEFEEAVRTSKRTTK